MPENVLGRLAERAKNAAENAVGNKVENTINNGIEKATSKKQKENAEDVTSVEARETVTAETAPAATEAKGNANKKAETAYVKSDFVPGDEIIFEDLVEGGQLGEFPSKWDLKEGNAEIAAVNGEQAILLPWNVDIFPLMKDGSENYLGDVYTIEYDIMYDISESHLWMKLQLECPRSETNAYGYEIGYGSDATNYTAGYYRSNGDIASSSGDLGANLTDNKWHHLALSFNKRALKFYVDGQRVINVPNVTTKAGWFYIHKDNDGKAFIKNIRVAKGAKPLYDRLATEGKIITYAITFDTGKATLKPEAFTEINRIKGILDQDPGLKFEVQGHCDSTGSAAVNDKLSQQRAEAIVAALVDLGIARDRLTAVGKGSNEPIADNSTDEGRAKNRRVEFVKR